MIAIPVVGEVPGGIVPVGIGLHLLQMPDQVPVVLALEVEYIASVSLLRPRSRIITEIIYRFRRMSFPLGK